MTSFFVQFPDTITSGPLVLKSAFIIFVFMIKNFFLKRIE